MGKNIEKDGFVTPQSKMISHLVESYRNHLLENYKRNIFSKWGEEEGGDLFFTEELLTLAASTIKASDNEIMEMFFEEAFIKCSNMDMQDYFDELFKVAI